MHAADEMMEFARDNSDAHADTTDAKGAGMFSRLDQSTQQTPLFQQLADRVINLVETGALKPGDRLPPQRKIASEAGVNLSTVTRAFALLQQDGYVASRQGQGSIISDRVRQHDFKSAYEDVSGFIDLSVSRPANDAWLRSSEAILRGLSQDTRFAQTADFHPAQGPAWARQATSDWLEPFLGRNAPDRVILTNGAQHGLACALGAIAKPGGVVFTDPVTYQGAAALCQSLGLNLTSVPMDAGGMIPEALEAACQRERPAAVFLTPTLHNPLTLTLSAERRTALADIVRRHESLILEDDVYRPLMPNAPDAIAAAHDDITIYISSLSKCAAPGVRFGALSAPAHLVADITTMLRVNCWSTPPLTALIVTRMVETGQLAAIIDEQRAELAARHDVLSAFFVPDEIDMVRGAPHAWLKPPAPWRGDDFVRAAAQNGIGLLPGAAFAVSRDKPAPDAARINIAAIRSRAQLERAAQVLRRLMDTSPALANPLA